MQTSHTCEVAITAAAEKADFFSAAEAAAAPLELEPIVDDKRQFAVIRQASDGSLKMLTAMGRLQCLQRWIAENVYSDGSLEMITDR